MYGISDEELKKRLLEKEILSPELKLLQLAKPMKALNMKFKNAVQNNL